MDSRPSPDEVAGRRIGEAAADGHRWLSLAGLGLESVPPEVRLLTGLRALDLSENRLVALPDWLVELRSLSHLNLSGNRLVELPRALGRLDLRALDLTANPHLLSPPPEVAAGGIDSVLAYLREPPPEAAAAWPRAARIAASSDAPGDEATVAFALGALDGAGPKRRAASAGRRPTAYWALAAAALALGTIATAAVVHSGDAGSPTAPNAHRAAAEPPEAGQPPSPTPSIPATPPPSSSSATATSASPSTSPSTPASKAASNPPAAQPSATAAAPARSVTGAIHGWDSLCLDNADALLGHGDTVQGSICNGSDSQAWTASSADGTIRIFGACLDPLNGGGSAGTGVGLSGCDGSPSQTWTATTGGALRDSSSGLCLDDPRSPASDGDNLDVAPCDGGAHQRWVLP